MQNINNIKFGLKLWSINYNLLREAERLIKEEVFHFIELMVVPGTEVLPFQKIKAPFIIHITSEAWGVNITDKEKEEFNLKIINKNIEWADKLKAQYLILHPGFGEIEVAKIFLEKIKDRRILIENMPKVGLNNERMIGFTLEQIQELKKDKFGFCLDFNHTIKAAISLKKNYKEYIEEFLELEPALFHISDGNLEEEKDKHLNLGEGKYDLLWIKNILTKEAQKRDIYLVFEIPKNKGNLKKDIENINYFKNL